MILLELTTHLLQLEAKRAPTTTRPAGVDENQKTQLHINLLQASLDQRMRLRPSACENPMALIVDQVR